MTPLTLSESRSSTARRHTPSEVEIKRLHEQVIERQYGERDSLMFSWAEECGPRRAEFLQIGKRHMPTLDQLADIIERDEPWLIAVRRKGGTTSNLLAQPDLIIRTLDWIQHGRRQIVDTCRKTIVGYSEPDEVFLSSTTGLSLNPDSVTTIGRRTFKAAGIENANVHRLRARFCIRVVETLVEAVFDGDMRIDSESNWVETILVKAAEQMGHTSPQSLRPYLNYVLNRRIRTADTTKAHKLAARLRQLELHEISLVKRLERQRTLQAAARLIQAGKTADAASALHRLADELD